jgi:hypothetical protein
MTMRGTGQKEHAQNEALRYWYAQEQSPLPDTDPFRAIDVPQPLPSGWWLAPALALSLALWAALGWCILV